MAGDDHAWIRLENCDTHEVHTLGRYNVGSGGRDTGGKVPEVTVPGVQYDRDRLRDPGFQSGQFPSRSIVVDGPDIFYPGRSPLGYDHYNNNCATYAMQAWRHYSGEQIPGNLIWYDDPVAVKNWILWKNNPPPAVYPYGPKVPMPGW